MFQNAGFVARFRSDIDFFFESVALDIAVVYERSRSSSLYGTGASSNQETKCKDPDSLPLRLRKHSTLVPASNSVL